MPPTFDGQLMFGEAVQMVQNPVTAAFMQTAVNGGEGQFAVYAGSRGRTWNVQGLFTGATPADCIAYQAAWLSYVGFRAVTLVDTNGVAWFDVIFKGEIQCPGSPRPAATATGATWAWPYQLILQGLR